MPCSPIFIILQLMTQLVDLDAQNSNLELVLLHHQPIFKDNAFFSHSSQGPHNCTTTTVISLIIPIKFLINMQKLQDNAPKSIEIHINPVTMTFNIEIMN